MLPANDPVNPPAVKLLVTELKVKLAFVLGAMLPVAVFENKRKQVVSVTSVVALILTEAVATLAVPVNEPTNAPVNVTAERLDVRALKVKLALVFGERLPEAAVENNGKLVVSAFSAPTVTVPAFPVTEPEIGLVTVKLVRVPSEVRKDVTTDDPKVVPVKVPAGATTGFVLAAVMSPLAFTAKAGIAVEEPKFPTFEFTVAKTIEPLLVSVASPTIALSVAIFDALPTNI